MYYGTGRRKNAVARVRLVPGTGKVTINGKDVAAYFVDAINAAKVVQPFAVTETEGRYDVVLTVAGGGICSQAEACRHGLARALVAYDEAYRKALRQAGYMTRDPRMVERKKYGQRGARRRFQFSKR